MKFSIGDLVLLKQTGEEGFVFAIINEKIIEVSINEIVFPVFVEDVDHPYLNWFIEKRKKNRIQPNIEQLNNHPVKKVIQNIQGFYLSFYPQYKFDVFEDIIQGFKVYFSNQSHFLVHVDYECMHLGNTIFSHLFKSIPKETHQYLHDISWNEINEQAQFKINVQHAEDDQWAIKELTIKIKPKKLFELVQTAQQKNEPVINIDLFQEFDVKTVLKKTIPSLKANSKAILQLPRSVNSFKNLKHYHIPDTIDLHMQKLIQNHIQIESFEMFSLQLSAFKRFFEQGIIYHKHRLTVIHGIGSGKLKEAIHQYLKQQKGIKNFKNEWHPQYGYGATVIYL